jgi:glycosyltransferase involved in cell wall biosynthesis
MIMPAYNASKTLEATVKAIPSGSVDEIVLVDDCSSDDTVAIAERLGLSVVKHEKNRGYGANQKTCYAEALRRGADVIVMVHPDYQYDPRVVPYMTGLIADGVCDVMLGNRIRTRREALSGGMPVYKYYANRVLTAAENFALGQNLGEFHSGLRAYARSVLKKINWMNNSDDFVFDQEFLIQAAFFGFKIGDVPVPTKYFKEASSISFKRSVEYGLSTLGALLKYILHKSGIIKSGLFVPPDGNAR